MGRFAIGLVCAVAAAGGLCWLFVRRKGTGPGDDEVLQPPPFASGGKENDPGAGGRAETTFHRSSVVWEDMCTESTFCSWTSVVDVAIVSEANGELSKGLISPSLHARQLSSAPAFHVCMPSKAATCAATALKNGPDCPESCPFVTVQTKGWEKSQEEEEACSDAVVTNGYCTWSSSKEECSFVEGDCTSVGQSEEKLFTSCQSSSFCADLDGAIGNDVSTLCADDGAGPGLDMCVDTGDRSKRCALCQQRVAAMQGTLHPRVQFQSNCEGTAEVNDQHRRVLQPVALRSETSGPFTADPSCVEVANIVQAHSTESSFELPPATVSSLARGDYQFRLDVTSHLSESSFSDIVFTRAEVAVPVVGIFGEQDRDFEISKGFKISAFVDKSSVCDIYTDQSSVDVQMTALGSPLVAKLDGPTGDVVLKEDICLDASGSYDPDDPSALSELSATWRCEVDELGGEACFTGTMQPIIEGTRLCIPKEALVPGRWHFYTVSISRTDLEQTRSASAVVQFRPRPEGSLIPTGRAKPVCGSMECPATLNPSEVINLTVTVDEEHKDGTSISWWCSDLQDLENNVVGRNLVIRPGVVPGGAEVECTATLRKDGVEDTGEVVVSFATNKPPYCERHDW
ncbi:hypothetical protein BSKO_13512 [Bryopsis sp. KO-2023]|nr:hypothetical protein BSKO_13512 [Bryopsis sp. KO-2023]